MMSHWQTDLLTNKQNIVLSMFWPGKVMLAKLDTNIGLKNNNKIK